MIRKKEKCARIDKYISITSSSGVPEDPVVEWVVEEEEEEEDAAGVAGMDFAC